MGIYPPCKDCTARDEHCHATCEAYKKYRVDLAELKRLREKNREVWTDRFARVPSHNSIRALRKGGRNGTDKHHNDA